MGAAGFDFVAGASPPEASACFEPLGAVGEDDGGAALRVGDRDDGEDFAFGGAGAGRARRFADGAADDATGATTGAVASATSEEESAAIAEDGGGICCRFGAGGW